VVVFLLAVTLDVPTVQYPHRFFEPAATDECLALQTLEDPVVAAEDFAPYPSRVPV
jgi:hypothetical protein